MNENYILIESDLLSPKYFAENDIPRQCGPWPEFATTMTICVDSFDNELANGRLHNFYFENEIPFLSLDQLLFGLEEIMDRADMPQRYAEMRTIFAPEKNVCGRKAKASEKSDRYSQIVEPAYTPHTFHVVRGKLANFFVKVCYRQHSSMQGYLSWSESGCKPVCFRSGLELLSLIREALRASSGDVSAI